MIGLIGIEPSFNHKELGFHLTLDVFGYGLVVGDTPEMIAPKDQRWNIRNTMIDHEI